MTPESLVALLLVVCLAGLMGLGVLFYFLRRRTESRLETLSHLFDSLDERTIHEFSTIERKTEEMRSSLEGLGSRLETEFRSRIEEEHLSRVSEAEGIREQVQSIRTDLNDFRDLVTSLTEEGKAFREKLETEIRQEIEARLSELSEKQAAHEKRVEEFEDRVRRVHIRNELQVALAQLTAGYPRNALTVLRELLEEDPSDREAVLLAGRAYRECREVDEGEAVLKAALDRFPGDPDILAELARLRFLAGDKAGQARYVAEGLVRDPEHVRLRFERALSLIESEKFESALEDLEFVLGHGVETAEVRYNLGIVQVALGNIPAALSQFRRSIALEPTSYESNHALGLALLSAESYREASDFLSRARDLKPEDLTVRLDLAAALRLAGEPEAALKECSVARRLNPRVPRTELEEALARHDLAEFKEALECLDNLLQWQPDYLEARRLKAQILTEIDRLDEALSEWSLMVERFPNDPTLRVALGDVLKKSGRADMALRWYEAAARMAPDSPEIQLCFAKEALAQKRFEVVQTVIDQTYPRVTTPQSRLQFLEIRLLLALAFGRWVLLERILAELKQVLEENPEVIPLDKKIELQGSDLLNLELTKEATRIHNGLLELYDGIIDFDVFDEQVTEIMRSLLPPAPAPPPSVETPPAELVEGGPGRDGKNTPEDRSRTEEPVEPAESGETVSSGESPEEPLEPVSVEDEKESPSRSSEEGRELTETGAQPSEEEGILVEVAGEDSKDSSDNKQEEAQPASEESREKGAEEAPGEEPVLGSEAPSEPTPTPEETVETAETKPKPTAKKKATRARKSTRKKTMRKRRKKSPGSSGSGGQSG